MNLAFLTPKKSWIGPLSIALGSIVSGAASADSGWDVALDFAPSTTWEVEGSATPSDSSWDVVPAPTTPSDSSWDAGDYGSSVPAEAWDVSSPPATPAPTLPVEESAWELPEAPSRPIFQSDYDSLAVTSGAMRVPTLALRLTVAGYRETIGASVAWVKPEFFELELGYFSDLFARWKLVIPAEEEGEAPTIIPQKGKGHGFYGRASISYPMLNQRGLRERAWVLNAIVGVEARGLVIQRDFALFFALAGGLDAQLWHSPNFGWSMGAFVTLPMWELTSGQSLALRPILRTYVGIVF